MIVATILLLLGIGAILLYLTLKVREKHNALVRIRETIEQESGDSGGAVSRIKNLLVSNGY